LKNLQDATERICELKGALVALDAVVMAALGELTDTARRRLADSFDKHAEAARTAILHADISDVVLGAFERDVARHKILLAPPREVPLSGRGNSAETVLFAVAPVSTFSGRQTLTGASGFFFRREQRLFVVTNRHVFADAETSHFPDRIEIGIHTDARDLTRSAAVSLPLYRNGLSLWMEATDSGGAVDVAALEVLPETLPGNAVLQAFDASSLEVGDEDIAIGDSLTIVGYPLGFHDTVHHLAVARSASVASAYGIRFQQQGCFLTDARTHRGSSGAPVVRRRMFSGAVPGSLSWQLLGVHSTRMDMRGRDHTQDESLGLNCAWYADVLTTLTNR